MFYFHSQIWLNCFIDDPHHKIGGKKKERRKDIGLNLRYFLLSFYCRRVGKTYVFLPCVWSSCFASFMSGVWSLIKAGTWTPVRPCIGWVFCVFVVFMLSLVSFPCFMKFGAIAWPAPFLLKKKVFLFQYHI